jgi:hypothetical protein
MAHLKDKTGAIHANRPHIPDIANAQLTRTACCPRFSLSWHWSASGTHQFTLSQFASPFLICFKAPKGWCLLFFRVFVQLRVLPNALKQFNIVSGPIWMTPVSNPTHVLQVNQCALQIYVLLPATSGRVLVSEVHISARNATPFWTISYSTVGLSCSFLQRII